MIQLQHEQWTRLKMEGHLWNNYPVILSVAHVSHCHLPKISKDLKKTYHFNHRHIHQPICILQRDIYKNVPFNY